MMPLIGSDTLMKVVVKTTDKKQQQLNVPLTDWHLDDKKPDPLKSLGIEPFLPTVPPIIGEVVPDTPAARSGLQLNESLLR